MPSATNEKPSQSNGMNREGNKKPWNEIAAPRSKLSVAYLIQARRVTLDGWPNDSSAGTAGAAVSVETGWRVRVTESMADRAAPAVVQPRLVRLCWFVSVHCWMDGPCKGAWIGNVCLNFLPFFSPPP